MMKVGLIVRFSFGILLAYSCSIADENSSPQKDEIWPSILIVPDIQNYTHLENRLQYLDAIVDYYLSNKDQFDAIIQVGDLTNNNRLWQFENAYGHFISRFTDTDQLVFCLGNHDYGFDGSSDTRTSNFQEYMMPTYDVRMEGSQWENYVRYISFGGQIVGVLVLEFCTRNETLDWANSIISNNANTPFIIVTHAFLNDYGHLFNYTNANCYNAGSPKYYRMSNEYSNDSKEIFDKLIYNNPNIELVICGHSLTHDYINVITKKNSRGDTVRFIMVNYQHFEEGGKGLVGLLSKKENGYLIRSYSTMDNCEGDIKISF